MSRRRGLGRGLDALIPSGEDAGAGDVAQLDVGAIAPNPRQPRGAFEPADLQELADSIRQHGVLQPLIVARLEGQDQLLLVAGERRLEAAKLAGLATVPAVIRQATEEQFLVWALIENLQREDLNPIEAAQGYQQLAEDFGLSHQAIADRVGKSRSAVSNVLRLLNLPPALQQAVQDQTLSEGHARALLGLASGEAMEAALKTVLERQLNVRQTEALVRKLSGKRGKGSQPPSRSPEEKALEDELRQALGTKVSLRRGKQGGRLTLHFYSDEELNALVERLLGGG